AGGWVGRGWGAAGAGGRRGRGQDPAPPVPGASTLIVWISAPSSRSSNGAHISRLAPIPMSSSSGRPSPRTATRSGTPSIVTVRTTRRPLDERADTGDVPSDDQCLDRLGALVRVDGLDIGHMPHDVVVEQDAVA